eukprot:729093_1
MVFNLFLILMVFVLWLYFPPIFALLHYYTMLQYLDLQIPHHFLLLQPEPLILYLFQFFSFQHLRLSAILYLNSAVTLSFVVKVDWADTGPFEDLSATIRSVGESVVGAMDGNCDVYGATDG